MKSVWQDDVREELKRRLSHLTPGTTPGWGKMTAPLMILHISNTVRSALGELKVKSKGGLLRYPPLKQLIIYWVPFPRNVPTSPELLAGKPGEWSSDVAALGALFDRFASRRREGKWTDHAAFGSMTGDDWGVLMYRHTDHHLRQFGV